MGNAGNILQGMGKMVQGIGQAPAQYADIKGSLENTQAKAEQMKQKKEMLDVSIKDAKINSSLTWLNRLNTMELGLRKAVMKTDKYAENINIVYGVAPNESTNQYYQDQKSAEMRIDMFARANELRKKGIDTSDILAILKKQGVAFKANDLVMVNAISDEIGGKLSILEKQALTNEGTKATTGYTKAGTALRGAQVRKTDAETAEIGREGEEKVLTPFQKKAQEVAGSSYAKKITGLPDIDTQVAYLDDAFETLQDYTSKSWTGGTGRLATIKSRWTGGLLAGQKTQNLNAKFRMVDLKNMVKTFEGLSRAVDSEADRVKWEATQPHSRNDDDVNANILLWGKAIAQKMKLELEDQRDWVDQYGSLDKYRSRISGKTKSMVNPNGEIDIVLKSEVGEAKKAGYLSIGDYVSRGKWLDKKKAATASSAGKAPAKVDPDVADLNKTLKGGLK